MGRRLLLFMLIASSGLLALSVAAQDEDSQVFVHLFTFAEFPLVRKHHDVRYPTVGITERKRLDAWLQAPEDGSASPEYFEVIAVVHTFGRFSAELIELELTRDRKIGEFYDPGTSSPELEWERALWEGAVPIDIRTTDEFDGDTETLVRFGPFSTEELWMDLAAQELWPWQIRYEVTVRCNSCPPHTADASFTMTH